jgi:hypothetical protein
MDRRAIFDAILAPTQLAPTQCGTDTVAFMAIVVGEVQHHHDFADWPVPFLAQVFEKAE